MNGFFFLVYSCPALQDAIRAPSRKDEKKRRKRGNEFGITALAPPPPLPPQVGSAAAREFAIRHLQSQPTVQKLRPTSRSNNRPPPPVYAERRSDFKCDGCGGFSDFPPSFVSHQYGAIDGPEVCERLQKHGKHRFCFHLVFCTSIPVEKWLGVKWRFFLRTLEL